MASVDWGSPSTQWLQTDSSGQDGLIRILRRTGRAINVGSRDLFTEGVGAFCVSAQLSALLSGLGCQTGGGWKFPWKSFWILLPSAPLK